MPAEFGVCALHGIPLISFLTMKSSIVRKVLVICSPRIQLINTTHSDWITIHRTRDGLIANLNSQFLVYHWMGDAMPRADF